MDEFLYEYDLSTIYMLINKHNEQEFKNKLLGRIFLSDEPIEEFAKKINEMKTEESQNNYQEVRAVEFL